MASEMGHTVWDLKITWIYKKHVFFGSTHRDAWFCLVVFLFLSWDGGEGRRGRSWGSNLRVLVPLQSCCCLVCAHVVLRKEIIL